MRKKNECLSPKKRGYFYESVGGVFYSIDENREEENFLQLHQRRGHHPLDLIAKGE